RRASVRFDVDLAGTLDGRPCRVLDLSLTGARVVLPGTPWAGSYDGELVVDGIDVHLRATARSGRVRPDGTILVGLRFEPGQDEEQARLALALFNAEQVPRLVPGEAPEVAALAS
ncbi:MAG: PilZ domain-containing protein, partial [Acidimicrobiales bacterium]